MGLNLEATIGLNSASFEKGMHRVTESVADTIKGFAIGAIGIGTLESAIDKTIESASELVNTARNLSMTTDQLQIMRKAAEENGKEFGVMTTAIERFNAVRENILHGGKGSKEQMAAMSRLGLTRENLKNQTAAQSMMGQVSETARKSNAADIANDLKQVFGKGGADIFGVLSTDFAELGASMKSHGEIMDATSAVELKRFKDELAAISKIMEAGLAPVLVEIAKGLLYANAAIGTFGTMLGTWAGNIAELILHPVDVLKNPQKAFKDLFGMGISGEAGESAKEYFTSQMGKIGKIDEEAKARANAVENPIAQGELNDESEEKKSAKEGRLRGHKFEGDSLVRVGNFLGTNRAGITGASRMEMHASATARNTKLTVDALYALQRNLFRGEGANMNPQQRAQQFMEIHKDQWPTN
jgi:hypothetical protein